MFHTSKFLSVGFHILQEQTYMVVNNTFHKPSYTYLP